MRAHGSGSHTLGHRLQVHAHTADVNVIAWNRLVSYLVVSGSDDGSFRSGRASASVPPREPSCFVRALAWQLLQCAPTTAVQHGRVLTGVLGVSNRIWDLRNLKDSTPIAHFKWHKDAVTSVEWHPTEGSMLAVGAADSQVRRSPLRRAQTRVPKSSD